MYIFAMARETLQDGNFNHFIKMQKFQMQCQGYTSVPCHLNDIWFKMNEDSKEFDKKIEDSLEHTSCVDWDTYFDKFVKAKCGAPTAKFYKMALKGGCPDGDDNCSLGTFSKIKKREDAVKYYTKKD